MDETMREGGCGCGHVRYRVAGEPVFVNNCHCRQCQQQTGSTSVVNAFFEAERVTLRAGTLVENTVKAGSGGPHVINRCAECGSALWSFYPRLGRLGLGLRVGTLDDPGAFRPTAVIYTAEAMPWVSFPPDIPRFEANYNQAEVLPPGGRERMGALFRRRHAGEG